MPSIFPLYLYIVRFRWAFVEQTFVYRIKMRNPHFILDVDFQYVAIRTIFLYIINRTACIVACVMQFIYEEKKN